ncbi:hypothetical protein CU669_01065 [Paramagnetospirillum kuznetsovii]|uniref:Uncharacterized protein n=1 Tax=Paramagnetospirillum kuznetsovii TaxID=2053833 RepID=A0A364P3N4_9PROT|nr:hypothetical protein [Paramagnetospirillum kuznetsovii]RAU23725.1 hypothetical protein CU669_01065 [Paramagnetospirillum kuznetsovii]
MAEQEGSGPLDELLANIPEAVVQTFSPEQRAALWNAAKPVSWRKHPINIRITFPFVGNRYFVTVVGGQERRDIGRIHRDRHMHPLRTAGNILFMLGLGGAFYLAAVIGMFTFSNLIEF